MMQRSLAGQMSFGVACLAGLCLALAGLGVFLLQEAQMRLDKGYLASEIHASLVSVAHDKARLRVWAYRAVLAENDTIRMSEVEAERIRLLTSMSYALARIEALDREARGLQRVRPSPDPEEATRATTIAALSQALEGLARETAPLIRTPAAGQDQALAQLDRDLDTAEGSDLPELMDVALAAEADALARERLRAETAMARARTASLGAAVLAFPSALSLAIWLGVGLRRPLAQLEAGLAAYAAGDTGHKLGAFRHREFDQLARQFDSMAEEIDRHRAREASAREALEAEVAFRTAELEDALRALAASDRARTQLLADVSHGLRTPVTVIRGEGQVALRGPKEPEALSDALIRIVEVTRQMERLIEDLLVLTQTSSAHSAELGTRPAPSPPIPLEIGAIDLAEAIGPALLLAQRHGLEREVTVCAQVPPALRILADPARFQQVMGCLLENAVRYSHRGGEVTLSAAYFSSANGPAIRLEITDQGIGITPEERAHLCDRGWRSEAARAHRPDGLGLGLAIAQELVQAQGADMTLAPNPNGTGTLARLDWPAVTSPIGG